MNHPENSPYRRRRRPYGFVGTAVTTALAVYGTYHLAMWAWNAWKTSDDDGDDDTKQEGNAAQQQHRHVKHRVTDQIQQQRRCMAQCRRQTAATLAAFNAMLMKKIEEGTETTMVRRQLKEIRKLQSDDTKHQESILWMSIQVETVTRLMTMAYATTLLFTTLTIQVYRLGGRMYNHHSAHKQTLNVDDCNSIYDLDGQEALLKSYDTFWERDGGLDDLLEFVRSAVQTALKTWNIHDPKFALQMSFAQLIEAISRIRTSVEAKGDLLQRFIIMNDGLDTTDNTESQSPSTTATNNALLNEMYDLLESPVANDAIRDALQCVFTLLQQQYIAPIFVGNDNNNKKSSSTNGDEIEHDTNHDNTLPLPHVISQLKVMTNSFMHSESSHDNQNNNGHAGSNVYVAAMERLPSIQEAARISFGALV